MGKNSRTENPKKYHEKICKIKHTCKCGHVVMIPVYKDRTLCSYCGFWVYKTPKLEFEYKLKEKMKKWK